MDSTHSNKLFKTPKHSKKASGGDVRPGWAWQRIFQTLFYFCLFAFSLIILLYVTVTSDIKSAVPNKIWFGAIIVQLTFSVLVFEMLMAKRYSKAEYGSRFMKSLNKQTQIPKKNPLSISPVKQESSTKQPYQYSDFDDGTDDIQVKK